jgi:hypothetical protein
VQFLPLVHGPFSVFDENDGFQKRPAFYGHKNL